MFGSARVIPGVSAEADFAITEGLALLASVGLKLRGRRKALNRKLPDHNASFTLRVRLYRKEYDPRLITIVAYDDLGWDSAGRVRLTCEVRHRGKVIFPRGQLTCALHGASDGIAAKELVMSLVAMKSGDTDEDYFADYTPEQREWAETYGEALSCERESRYCDPETGSVRDE